MARSPTGISELLDRVSDLSRLVLTRPTWDGVASAAVRAWPREVQKRTAGNGLSACRGSRESDVAERARSDRGLRGVQTRHTTTCGGTRIGSCRTDLRRCTSGHNGTALLTGVLVTLS